MTYAESDEWRDRFSAVPFESKKGTWEGRYYQTAAIKRALKAVASRKNRILLTLATGTGEDLYCFSDRMEVISEVSGILDTKLTEDLEFFFLADRNILADQAYNSFSSFDEDALARIRHEEIRKGEGTKEREYLLYDLSDVYEWGE